MPTNKQSTSRSNQKRGNQEKNFSGMMRFFYILMLLLTISSLVLRVSGARRSATPKTSGGTAARVLVFHHDDGSSCEDLAITVAGGAIFSNCGNGMEKQYALSGSERVQLQSWIDTYNPVNYDHHDKTQTSDLTTQFYLNGRGKQQADNVETQQIINFATALATKIASSP